MGWNIPPPSGSVVVGRPQVHPPRLRPLTSPIMFFRHPHFYPNPGKRNLHLARWTFHEPLFGWPRTCSKKMILARCSEQVHPAAELNAPTGLPQICHPFQFPQLTGRHHLHRQPPNATIGDRLIKMADAHAVPGPTTGGGSQSLQLAKGAVTRIGSSACTR
jgi:hypothetical protein